jgi:hypothetical protein
LLAGRAAFLNRKAIPLPNMASPLLGSNYYSGKSSEGAFDLAPNRWGRLLLIFLYTDVYNFAEIAARRGIAAGAPAAGAVCPGTPG